MRFIVIILGLVAIMFWGLNEFSHGNNYAWLVTGCIYVFIGVMTCVMRELREIKRLLKSNIKASDEHAKQ